jgi:pyridoxal phosphate enzyme (YggS family)
VPGGAEVSPDLASTLAANLARVRERIHAAGGDPGQIEIVAVTKGQPVEACRAAFELGLTGLGENRVQEALGKIDRVPNAQWHLIGHLQTNKARHASRFALIQSLDSWRLAQALAAHSSPPVLLEVNVSREDQKHGAPPDGAVQLAVEVAGILDLRGFMAMGPASGDAAAAFSELRHLREQTQQRLGRSLPVLSMGMSDDLEAAVREGSTMLRLGRAIFGDRTL